MDANFRLGLYRRNRRNYSLHLRRYGKNVLDRMNERDLVAFRKVLRKVMLVVLDDPKETELLELSILAFIHAGNKLRAISSPYLGFVDIIANGLVALDSFSDQQLDRYTGFGRDKIVNMIDQMQLPEYIALGQG